MKNTIIFTLLLSAIMLGTSCQDDEPDKFTVYEDADGDGFGNEEVPLEVIKETDGFVEDNTDCDDTDPAINPDATEIPDNDVDENCDGQKNATWYRDADEDEFGDSEDSQESDMQPIGYVSNDQDCDDTDPAINPDATEIADNDVDEDCDGGADMTWYQDFDGDGYGNVDISQIASEQPNGYVLDNTDCNDQNAEVNPGATEVSGDDGLDNNCDGMALVICADGAVEGVEECDDGNTTDGDGCAATCEIEADWECQGSPSNCEAIDTDGDGTPDYLEIPGCENNPRC